MQRAGQHVDAYFEYYNLVGEANGNQLLSQKQYEALQRQAAEANRNRVIVSWRNSRGTDCKFIGPATKCFCNHRFREHDSLSEANRCKAPCKMAGCRCRGYDYLPAHGTFAPKCTCKHGHDEHEEGTARGCKKPRCTCTRFSSDFRCVCGETWAQHTTVFEPLADRRARLPDAPDQESWTETSGAFKGGLGGFRTLAAEYDAAAGAADSAPPSKMSVAAGGRATQRAPLVQMAPTATALRGAPRPR